MNTTQIFVIGMLILTLAMDVVLIKDHLHSESQEIRDWALRWTWLPLGLGIVLGHWCFPGHMINGDLKVVLPSMLLLFIGDLCYHHFEGEARVWWRYPGLYALAGIPIGLFFWGQPV